MRRRSFLKKSIAAGTVVPAIAATGAARRGRTEYEGIVYDPVSRDVFGTASAELTSNGSRLKGALEVQSDRKTNLERDTIPLDVEREGVPSSQLETPMFQTRKRGEHAAGNVPLELKLFEATENITGVVIPPGAKTSGQRVGISIAPTDGDVGTEELIRSARGPNGGR